MTLCWTRTPPLTPRGPLRDAPTGRSLSQKPHNGTRETTGQLEALDGTKKALTTNGMTEEYGKRGPQGSQVSDDSELRRNLGGNFGVSLAP